MASLDEIRSARLAKLHFLIKKGINPYPAETHRDLSCVEALEQFDKLSKNGKSLYLVGRILSIRAQGAIAFLDIFDGTARFQALLKKGEPLSEESFELFQKAFDIGDFIEIKGTFFLTNKNEKTILVEEFYMLSKSLRPLPEKWHGLQDYETRFRHRYLDLLFNPKEQEIFKLKEKFWESARKFLKNEGFLEIETPTLEITTGGAEARPFKTHHNDFDLDVFLRISVGELWQKRLMAAGYEKTFEIGRVYRNEGSSPEHVQEFTNIEFYAAYMDFDQGKEFVKNLYRTVAKEVFGKTAFETRGHKFDFMNEWPDLDYVNTIEKMTGVNVIKDSLQTLQAKLDELGVKYDGNNKERITDSLWKHCRKTISGPAFLVNHPKLVAPLSKEHPDNHALTKTFQVIIAGSEIGRAHSELNNPIEQQVRFNNQQALIEDGDEEAMMPDDEFVEMLEYGMPPTFGFGFGERLFAFLIDRPMREIQMFPLVKPKNRTTSKELFSAVAIINSEIKMEKWQELNTIAHLTAALGAREGRGLFFKDTIQTKDGENIFLNIKHAIIIKNADSSEILRKLVKKALILHLKVTEFTRDMLETTNDKKVEEVTKNKDMNDIEFLGILIFGPKSLVDTLTADLILYK